MKIAIVDLRTKKVQTTYEADAPNQSAYGGSWGRSDECEHVKIPVELESEPIENLEPYDGEEQTGEYDVQDGEEQAFGSDRKPIKNLLGAPVMIPVYRKEPIMSPIRLMRRKQ